MNEKRIFLTLPQTPNDNNTTTLGIPGNRGRVQNFTESIAGGNDVRSQDRQKDRF